MKFRNILLTVSSFLVLNVSVSPSISMAATSDKCPGETGYIYTNNRSTRNPRAGGFVSDSAFVGDDAFIAPTAAVCESASVLKSARIYGNAVVSGEAEVTEKARVYGNARVYGTALISGEAKVSDNSQVYGDAVVEGKAWIRGYTKISTGVVAEGAKKAAKPQSVIDAENRQAAAEKARSAQMNEQARLDLLELNSKASLRKIGRLLSNGGYESTNRNRQVTSVHGWSVSEIDNDNCNIEMREEKRQKEMKSGKKIGSDNVEYKTISMRSANLRGKDYTPFDGIEPGSCLSNYNKYVFCYSSYSERSEVVNAINNHVSEYCSGR